MTTVTLAAWLTIATVATFAAALWLRREDDRGVDPLPPDWLDKHWKDHP